jgi:chaperonin GroEL
MLEKVTQSAEVTRSALQNAASFAGLLLATDALVADKSEKVDTAAAAAAAAAGLAGLGGMGGVL